MKRGAAALAGLAALALVAGGCGGQESGAGGDARLSVYVSVPLDGPRGADGRAIADGARLALADARGRAGAFRVRAVYLDDTEAGEWSLARSAANARRAAQDAAAIGYIGELDSGATRASLPITNQAEIVQVSPGSTAVDLTRLPSAGGLDPDRLRPGDRETFARVVPDDEVQARAAAVWASRMGAERVGVASDGSRFGAVLEDAFLRQAAESGLGSGEGGGSDLVYYAGEPAGFATAMRGIPPRPVIGSDALLGSALLGPASGVADRLHVTSPFQDPSLLPARGRAFARSYRRRFGCPLQPAAAYGYEAMALLLDAIRRAGGEGDERGSVADEVLSTTGRRSVLGTYSIDGNGDTTLDTVSGYRIADGLPVFPVRLRAPR